MEDLFELLRIATGMQEEFSHVLDYGQWEALHERVTGQTLPGVTFPALDRLPASQRPPLKIYALWALQAESIVRDCETKRERARELASRLREKGLESCLLKGGSTALYYPEPDLRACGDIDVWVKGGMNKVLPAIRDMARVTDVCYHHCQACFFEDCKVEIHFIPSWMNSPMLNRRLQKYYESEAKSQFSRFNEALGVNVADDSFNAVHCFVHIYRHLLSEGVGLRQIMDCNQILLHLDGASREEVLSTLESLGMKRFAAAVMHVLSEVFGLDDEFLLCPPDEADGQFLLREISMAGNFGQCDKNTAIMNRAALPIRAALKMRRLRRFFFLAPVEVICAPMFKIWQHLWRQSL